MYEKYQCNGMFWNVFSPKMVVRQNNALPWKPLFKKKNCSFAMIVNDLSFLLIKTDS